jgi:hypothetical protein
MDAAAEHTGMYLLRFLQSNNQPSVIAYVGTLHLNPNE